MNVLLCEDDESYAETVDFMFSLFAPDDTVLHAATLTEAMDLLDQLTGIDVILLDLNLPDAKDLQALVTLSLAVPDIPIVVITAYPMWRQQALAIGAKAYKIKGNIGGEALVEAVHAIVDEAL